MNKQLLLEGVKSKLESMEGFGYQFTEWKRWHDGDNGFEIEDVGVAKIRIRFFVKDSGSLQTEIRAHKKEERERLEHHFNSLGYNGVQRNDNSAYLPLLWQGQKNMPANDTELIKRIMILINILEAETLEHLSQESLAILEHNRMNPKK